jgi:hypothetical protein
MDAPLKPLPHDWVEAIYKKFAVYWGEAFLSKWKGIPHEDLLLAWSEELAGFTGEELKRGLSECRKKIFPVSLPEFMLLCRPEIKPEEALYEALAQSQLRASGKDRWSHPAIFWTYYALSWEFTHLTTKELERRWMIEFHKIYGQGVWKDIPQAHSQLIQYEEPAPQNLNKRSRQIFDDLLKNWEVK